ncbi:hypothetical protein Cfor_11991 [Coptotermes formosanus]|uniref:EB domain-containing protein n=1 Tax=Coptotermes formosanus TaxID=36987 RepID=A0A6L2Q8C0_COPFO|nr:hypothetical protein Cfor_11991 [Coptotermes formosanus]
MCVSELGCVKDQDCQGAGWICVRNKCDCGDGYVKQDALCVNVTVALGGKCNTSGDCAMTPSGQTTRCLDGVCWCKGGYRPTAEKQDCVPKVRLGGMCNKTEDCMNPSGNRRECWQGVCSCKAGFRPTPNKKDCVKVVIGGWCNETRECEVTSNTRRCDNNVCVCSPSYVPSRKNDNTCLKVSNYNEFCEEDHQCVSANNRCEVPKCTCKKGYRWEEFECVNCQGRLIRRKEKSNRRSICRETIFCTVIQEKFRNNIRAHFCKVPWDKQYRYNENLNISGGSKPSIHCAYNSDKP